jgi:hypothetical protein
MPHISFENNDIASISWLQGKEQTKQHQKLHKEQITGLDIEADIHQWEAKSRLHIHILHFGLLVLLSNMHRPTHSIPRIHQFSGRDNAQPLISITQLSPTPFTLRPWEVT